jgi:hypothetical protein
MLESTSHPVPQPSASCPECGGECVPAEVKISAGAHLGAMYIQRPGTFWHGSSTLRALACSQCGLTRFYANHPAELLPK